MERGVCRTWGPPDSSTELEKEIWNCDEFVSVLVGLPHGRCRRWGDGLGLWRSTAQASREREGSHGGVLLVSRSC